MDWLIIENIRFLDFSHLDMETKLALKLAYQKLMKEERKHRGLIMQLTNDL